MMIVSILPSMHTSSMTCQFHCAVYAVMRATSFHGMHLPAGFANNEFMTTILQAYGIPHALVPFDVSASPRMNLTEQLWAPDGMARYAAYIM